MEKGTFEIKPYCTKEPKLTFDIEGGGTAYELKELPEGDVENAFEPLWFRMKITAPRSLKCFGNYPYKISNVFGKDNPYNLVATIEREVIT